MTYFMNGKVQVGKLYWYLHKSIEKINNKIKLVFDNFMFMFPKPTKYPNIKNGKY